MYYSDKRTDQHHVEWPEEVPPGYVAIFIFPQLFY